MKIVVTPKAYAPQSRPAPPVSERFGVDARSDFRVLLVSTALADMLFHGREDLSIELGGVMLGHHGVDELGAYVVVEEYVPALRAKGRAATLTFDHEAWREINAIKDERYPDLQVIGWFHTHPGYGIFLWGTTASSMTTGSRPTTTSPRCSIRR